MGKGRTLTVLHNRGDFDRGAHFAWQDFFASAWWAVWPDGLQVMDDDGVEYVVYSYQGKRRRTRQGLRNCACRVNPVNGQGGTVRVEVETPPRDFT